MQDHDNQQSSINMPLKPERYVYRLIDGNDLGLYVFRPKSHVVDNNRPAIVFFHGGAWNHGQPEQFFSQCRHLAGHGMVAISVQYRLRSTHNATPFDCVEDGICAMRWVRSRAVELGINPERIVAGGGSAGGHIAACMATDISENLSANIEGEYISVHPTALVLFNPVCDNGPGDWGHEQLGPRWRELSPAHHLHQGFPPTLYMIGDRDNLIPVKTAKRFHDKLRSLDVRCELKVYPGKGHAFFNPGATGNGYDLTTTDMDKFLVSLGYIASADG